MKKLLILLIVLTACATEEQHTNTVDKLRVLQIVNDIRARGYANYKPVSALSWCDTMEEAAFMQASYMHRTGDYSHVWDDNTGLFDRLRVCGFYGTGGENIAWGFKLEDNVMEAWVNSEGHLKTIMDKQYNAVGVARVGDCWAMVVCKK
ncbi:YkwD family protein [uncultured Mediterranean phage]|nr:YkwD family protein [uncultured Mediterranean phage]